MKFDKNWLKLYIVTDRAWLNGKDLGSQVEESIQNGATLVQLREKALEEAAFAAEAENIKAVCRKYGVPLIVNDSVEVALAVGADGVHVGQHDMAAGDVRKKLGPDKFLGVSAQTVEQAVAAERAGADYLGVGAVFSTSTKLDAAEVSIDTLKAICAAVSIPVVAIGGIGPDNIQMLEGSGVAGVAVVSAVFAQPDIGAATRRLRGLADKMAGGTGK